jgi:predicted O-methyltransferase YrrM
VVREFFKQPIDMLFIDGDHTYEGVKRDFELYRPLLKPGGIIAFHDVLDTPMHRLHGCEVHRLWQELPPHKALFSINGPWGGIGVTFA